MRQSSHHGQETGILLRAYAYGEADRLLVVLGEERGIFRVTAKGARKSRRRFMGRLEPFTLGSFQTRRYRGREYLEGVEVERRGDRIAGDLGRYYLASYACEAVLVHLEPDHPAREVYELLRGLLQDMSEAERFDDQLGRAAFELRFLELQGLLPGFGPCSGCGEPAEALVLDAIRAEWSCSAHTDDPGAPGRAPLEKDDWELLERIMEQGFPLRDELVSKRREGLRRVNRFAALLFAHQLPGRLRSSVLLNAHQRARLHPKTPTS